MSSNPATEPSPASSDGQQPRTFSNTWYLFFTLLGCAVGTGNVWRFSRIVSQEAGDNGGGAFLLQWLVFLVAWSIPMILAEYAAGRFARAGVPLAFGKLGGRKKIWMGIFMSSVAIFIGFYYAVVTGYCLYFLYYVIFHPLPTTLDESMAVWDGLQTPLASILCTIIVIGIVSFITWRGVKALEKANIVLVPTLLVIIAFTTIWALTLDGAGEGLRFLFTPDWKQLLNPTSYINALSQNAWDTSAGYGAFMTYAAYMGESEPAVKLAFLTPVTNNAVSLMCGMLMFSVSFALLGHFTSPDQKLHILRSSGPASTGLTFIWIPLLYSHITGGRVIAVFFFLALTAAALSSQLAFVEMAVRVLQDAGLANRTKAVAVSVVLMVAFGIPSAVKLEFLVNQDLVWGLGLMVSGLLFSILIIMFGVTKFRTEVINVNPRDWTVGRWWDIIMKFLIPAEVLVLLGWWIIYVPITSADSEWWNPFQPTSIATCFFQWGLLLLAAIGINAWLFHGEKVKEVLVRVFRRPQTHGGDAELAEVGFHSSKKTTLPKNKKNAKSKNSSKLNEDSAPLVENDQIALDPSDDPPIASDDSHGLDDTAHNTQPSTGSNATGSDKDAAALDEVDLL